jgi:hypothetical protein
MNRPSAGQATGLACPILVGVAAIALAIASIELSNQPHAHIWSNVWLLTAVALAGITVVVAAAYFVASIFAHRDSKPKDVLRDAFRDALVWKALFEGAAASLSTVVASISIFTRKDS